MIFLTIINKKVSTFGNDSINNLLDVIKSMAIFENNSFKVWSAPSILRFELIGELGFIAVFTNLDIAKHAYVINSLVDFIYTFSDCTDTECE